MVTYDPFPGSLEVKGANGGSGLKLGWEFVDRQAACQRSETPPAMRVESHSKLQAY